MFFLRPHWLVVGFLAFVAYLFVTHSAEKDTGLRTTCKEPNIENGRIYRGKKRSKTYNLGDRLKFLCDNEYNIIGKGTIKCTDDGLWSDNTPFCIEIVCHQLQQLQNGTITPNQKTPKIGSTVHVSCDDGYELIGKDELQCSINGTWVPAMMPYCQDVRNDQGNTTDSCEENLQELKTEYHKLAEKSAEQQKQLVQYHRYANCYNRSSLNNSTKQECEEELETLDRCIPCVVGGFAVCFCESSVIFYFQVICMLFPFLGLYVFRGILRYVCWGFCMFCIITVIYVTASAKTCLMEGQLS